MELGEPPRALDLVSGCQQGGKEAEPTGMDRQTDGQVNGVCLEPQLPPWKEVQKDRRDPSWPGTVPLPNLGLPRSLLGEWEGEPLARCMPGLSAH